MNVLFINVSISGSRYFPTGIGMIMTILKQRGVNVSLFDTNFIVLTDYTQHHLGYIGLSNKIGQTKPVEDDSDYLGTKSFNELVKDLQKTIDTNNPHLIGISALSVSYPLALELVRAVKIPEHCKVAIGGTHCKVAAEKVIVEDCFDYVFEYDAEESFPLLCDYISSDESISIEMIDGMYWKRKDNTVVHNNLKHYCDITKLPTIDLSWFDEKYFTRPYDGKLRRIINYEASRGCPYTCNYCINNMIHSKYRKFNYLKNSVRRKTDKQIIDELKELIKKHSFEMIVFMDETFLNQRFENFEKFANAYSRHIGLPFTISTRPETITEENVILLKKMNCASVSIGVESGNPEIRNRVLNRRTKNETIIRAFDILNKYKIRNSSLNIIGSPGETEQTIWDTIKLNRRINPSTISVAVLYPYDGTLIRKQCLEKGYLTETNASNIFNPIKTTILDLPTISKDKIEEYYLNFVSLCKTK